MSTTNVLHLWIEGEYTGRFEKSGNERPRLVYAQDAKRSVSLSLPLEGPVSRNAAHHFLEGLLPENEGARENMRSLTGAKSARSWDLLSAVESDLPGGIVLSSTPSGIDRDESYTLPATVDSIAARIARIHQGGSGFDVPGGGKPRFSLAGVQGKFALVQDGDTYFWPDSATPSTHILKPAHHHHHGLDEAESTSLKLAGLMGVNAPFAQVKKFAGQESFMIERFDRKELSDGTFSRIHTEDVVQALGKAPGEKYNISAVEIVSLLKKHGAIGSELVFIQQLAFNVTLGNTDAHGKNYSLIHREGRVEVAPIYDTVPIALFPQFSQELAMKVGKKKEARGVVPSDWVQLSRSAQLEEEEVLHTVRNTSEQFLEHVENTLGKTWLAKNQQKEFEGMLQRAERTLKSIPVFKAFD